MDTKLIDFTTEQLQVLLNCVVKRRYTINVGDVDTHEEMDTLILLQTQILNAIGKVGVQEEINSN